MEVLQMTKQMLDGGSADGDLFGATLGAGPDAEDAEARQPARPMSDQLLLGGAGAALLGIAAVFGWRELRLDPAYLVTLVALGGVMVSGVAKNYRATRTGLLTLLLCALLGGAWYAMQRSAALLPGLFVALGGGLLFLRHGYARARKAGDRVTIGFGFAALVATTLVASWAGYFHFLTAGVAVDAVARRLVLTLLWMAAGVALVVVSGKRRELAMRYSGYVFVAAALGKALLYDTTHLGGGLRVIVLLAAGVCLLGGAVLTNRGRQQ
jgi:hypothetical protein